ncbi:hypothetical protein ACNOYE_02860 [Nannocystaceae bacterium ST9]
MPETKPTPAKPKPKPRGMGVRGGLLAVLLAVVAALAIWLSDCVPGFGIGGEGEGEGAGQPASDEKPKAEPAEAEVAPASPAGEPAPTIEIGVLGCSLADEPVQPCAELCKRIEKGELEGRASAILKSEQGSHADVTAVIDCLKAAGITKLAIEKG